MKPAAGIALAAVLVACRQTADPETYLWAWHRPEDLRFLAGSTRIGVAYLAATVHLRDGAATVELRQQPLLLPEPRPKLIAVTRVEARGNLTDSQRERLRDAIIRTASASEVTGAQIDFDATVSQRSFYAQLLREVRATVKQPLSITALASWCLGDNWIAGLPINEAVPMLFRMSVDDATVRAHLAKGRDFAEPLCRQSIGVSTDEPPPQLPEGRRLYVFSPSAWKREQVNATLRALHRLP